MLKPTKRKAFNFLRSYYDVLNELENDKDKLSFLISIIDKQFLNEDPKDLDFIVNLCYQSQRHSIESSVKGWIRVSSEELTPIIQTNPTTNPTTNRTTNPKEVEEKGEVEEKEKVKKEVTPLAIFTFSEFWSLYPHKVAKDKCEPKYEKLSNSDKVKIKSTLNNFLAIKPFAEYNHPNPLTYLNQKRWNDEVKKENSTFAPANPENEEIVTYYDNVNPTRRQITRSKFELMKVRNAEGGYIYSEIPQR